MHQIVGPDANQASPVSSLMSFEETDELLTSVETMSNESAFSDSPPVRSVLIRAALSISRIPHSACSLDLSEHQGAL